MKICDLQEKIGSRELHSMDAKDSLVKTIGYEEATAAFPEARLSKSQYVEYFPFKLCHSVPKVNSRGRAFMPRVLQKSFASLIDQCLDYEHELVENKNSRRDRIIGHVKAVKFDGSIPEAASSIYIPESPLPVIGLGCMYRRAEGVNKIVEQATKSPSTWRISMECYHNWDDAYFWLDRKDMISIHEASPDMLDCIGTNSIKPYKGKELVLCCGGMDKEIAFIGAAVTTNPADGDAEIMGFVSGTSRELASRKVFYMPMHEFKGKALEVASGDYGERDRLVEHTIKELSSIGIIGQTEPGGEDNHQHDVLNDGTIMPFGGHHHCQQHFILTPGTNPTYSGVTDATYDYVSLSTGERRQHVHNHMFNISLKKKARPATGTAASGGDNPLTAEYSSADLATATVTIGEEEMRLQDLMKELAKEMASLGAASKPDETSAAQKRILELAEKLDKVNAAEEMKTQLQTLLEEKIKSGELVTKERADAAIAEAKTAAEQQVEVEKKRLAAIASRTQKCTEAGINLGYTFDGVTNAEGKPCTVQDRINEIPVSDAGDRDFILNFGMWSKIAAEGKKKEDEAVAAAAAQVAAGREAASKSGQAANTMHVSQIAGGGTPAGGGENNLYAGLTGFGAKPEKVNKHTGGVHLITK